MSDRSRWFVTSFYRFCPIGDDRLASLKAEMNPWLTERGVVGLVILANEGINGTVAGSEQAIHDFEALILDKLGVDDILFKRSTSELRPFKRSSVDIRDEIVGLKRKDLVPNEPIGHLTPKEWHEFLMSDGPKTLIDTRNRYETMAGAFQGALDPNLGHFSDWPEFVDEANLPRDEPILIYCTGGIRCEKAALVLKEKGYDQVFQLQGGILGYLAQYPDGLYEGECFVFDDRVALDERLAPTERFGICPGCGLTSDNRINCTICGKECFVCDDCRPDWPPVCTKACRDRWHRLPTQN